MNLFESICGQISFPWSTTSFARSISFKGTLGGLLKNRVFSVSDVTIVCFPWASPDPILSTKTKAEKGTFIFVWTRMPKMQMPFFAQKSTIKHRSTVEFVLWKLKRQLHSNYFRDSIVNIEKYINARSLSRCNKWIE